MSTEQNKAKNESEGTTFQPPVPGHAASGSAFFMSAAPNSQMKRATGLQRCGDESLIVLDAIRGAVAKSLGRHDDFLGQGWKVTLILREFAPSFGRVLGPANAAWADHHCGRSSSYARPSRSKQ